MHSFLTGDSTTVNSLTHGIPHGMLASGAVVEK
jgi:hypothetical protein